MKQVLRAVVVWVAIFAGPVARASLDDALALVPEDARAFVVVPSLDRLSDSMHVVLHAMDRGHLILGSRPIDVFKSILGVTSAVADKAPAAAIMMAFDPADPLRGAVWVVPVTNEEMFLDANFEPGPEPGTYRTIHDVVLHARAEGGHMILGVDAALVEAFHPGADAATIWSDRLGDGRAHVAPAHAVMYASPSVLRAGAGAAGLGGGFADLLGSCEHLFVGLEFDPLAVIAREVVRFADDAPLRTASQGGAPGIARLSRIADQPYWLAGAIDLDGLGGRAALDARLRTLGWPALPPWLDEVDGAQFVAFEVEGAVLFERAGVIFEGQPDAVHAALRGEVERAGAVDDGFEREVMWRAADPRAGLDDVTLMAIRPQEIPPGRSYLDAVLPWVAARTGERSPSQILTETAVGTMLIGARGIGGTVARLDAGVVVVHGAEPALLAKVAGTNGPGSIDESFVTSTMRQWMPSPTDVELYLNPGRAVAAMSRSPLALAIDWPAFDPGQPPIGAAIDLSGGMVRSSIVIPNTLLVVVVDEILEQAKAPSE